MNVITVVNVYKHSLTHYCGREASYKPKYGKDLSILGNPFYLNKNDRYGSAIKPYRERMNGLLKDNSKIRIDALNLIVEDLHKGDVLLGCFCAPLACHCDIIKDVVINMYNKKYGNENFLLNKDSNGNYVGYHLESPFNDLHHPSLVEMKFTPNRVLFVSDNPSDWFPFHLKNRESYSILKITLKPKPFKIYTSSREYHNHHDIVTVDRLKDIMMSHISEVGRDTLLQGHSYIKLTSSIDCDEVMILDPINDVISIEKVEYSINNNNVILLKQKDKCMNQSSMKFLKEVTSNLDSIVAFNIMATEIENRVGLEVYSPISGSIYGVLLQGSTVIDIPWLRIGKEITPSSDFTGGGVLMNGDLIEDRSSPLLKIVDDRNISIHKHYASKVISYINFINNLRGDIKQHITLSNLPFVKTHKVTEEDVTISDNKWMINIPNDINADKVDIILNDDEDEEKVGLTGFIDTMDLVYNCQIDKNMVVISIPSREELLKQYDDILAEEIPDNIPDDIIGGFKEVLINRETSANTVFNDIDIKNYSLPTMYIIDRVERDSFVQMVREKIINAISIWSAPK